MLVKVMLEALLPNVVKSPVPPMRLDGAVKVIDVLSKFAKPLSDSVPPIEKALAGLLAKHAATAKATADGSLKKDNTFIDQPLDSRATDQSQPRNANWSRVY
jgi:hypothetical protein